MRGAVLRAVGEPLAISEDLRLRDPGPGEVMVALKASGVCHSDLSIQNGTLGTGRLPAALGHEGAGEVIAVGPGVAGVEPGDHVILVWIPPCGRCGLCLGGQPQLCTEVRRARAGLASPLSDAAGEVALGFGIGTFTEQTVVPVEAVVPIDRSVPFEVAALVGCGVMTGVGAVINTAKVRAGRQRRGDRVRRRGRQRDPGRAAVRRGHDRGRRPGSREAGHRPLVRRDARRRSRRPA